MNFFSRLDSSSLRRRPLLIEPIILAILLVDLPVAAGNDDAAPEPTVAEAQETVAATEPGDGAPARSTEAGPRSGLLVFVDPETGELTEPTPEQEERMRGRMAAPSPLGSNKSSQGLVPFPLEDGGRGVFLQKRFRSALRVQVLDDGSYEIRCSDHPDRPAGHEHPTEPIAAELVTEAAPES